MEMKGISILFFKYSLLVHLTSVLLRFSSVDSRGFRALREVGFALAIGVASVAAIVVIVVIVVVVIAIVIVVVVAAAVFFSDDGCNCFRTDCHTITYKHIPTLNI